jgi:hypothetical protein
MTVRQRVRVIRLFGRKFQQTHRVPNETETAEILAEVLNESDIILRSVGGLTIAWAEIEVFLDYTNGLLALNPVVAKTRFPRTTAPLDQKIEFLKGGFGMLPELAALHEKIPDLITELRRLQTIRNDVVHGVATERTPVGVRKVMRVETEGRFLSETYKTYSLPEIAYAWGDAVKLRDKLITLFADTFRVLDPARAKEFLSELPTFATASPPSALSGVAENAQQVGRHISRPVIYFIILLPNTIAGLVIGVTNSSLLNVVLASFGWATLTWLLMMAILNRASKIDNLRLIWWAIPFVTSLIIGSVTFAIRASLV